MTIEAKRDTTVRSWIDATLDLLLDDAISVNVKLHGGAHTSIVELHPNPAAFPILIGHKGHTVTSMRDLLNNYSRSVKHTYILNIIEPEPVRLRPSRNTEPA